MIHEGGCQCGAVRYAIEDGAYRTALCHCRDCQKSAGAPFVSWTAVPGERFRITRGEPVTHNSSGASMRSFCGTCGTGLWFINEEMLPGIVDIQTATFDDPDSFPAQKQVQVAERIGWMATAHDLPSFDRFGG
ncbi:MAG: GFA family protein [Novosphingobium sp.]|nr:GFA family protein [Novosphingobium sp.]